MQISLHKHTLWLFSLAFFIHMLSYNVDVMTCKFEWSQSLSLQWQENISVWCAAKCTSAAAPVICQTEGWCTLKTHSLPCGTHIYHQFMASPPTPAHLCSDIHPRHTTNMPRPYVASYSQQVSLICCHWICELCEDAIHKVGRAKAKKKKERKQTIFFVAECVGLVCLTSGKLNSSVTNRSAASGHLSNPQSR